MTDREPTLLEVLHSRVEAEKALSRQLADYKGQFVAVLDHRVVASGKTFDEVLSIIRENDVNAEAIFEVQEQEAACFF